MNDAVVGLQRSGVPAKYYYGTRPPQGHRRSPLKMPTPGDIVLLAGKGHEKVQITKEGTIPFDDVDVAQESLKALGYDCVAATAGGAGKTA